MPRRRTRQLVASTVLALVPLAVGTSAAPAAVTPLALTQGSVITTLAGTGEGGFSGNGGPATAAMLRQPRDTAVGPDGSIYVTDTRNNRIRRISPAGVISTFAGTGVGGFGGDGGPATRAQLQWPHDVTVDAAGTVYVADSNNQRIRRIGSDGVISTIVGTGDIGFNGDGRPATETDLKYPKSLALHAGALFFADSLNQRIRRMDLRSGLVTTVAGSGERGFGGDGGSALLASFDTPQRIAIDSAGNIYIADTKNNRVRLVRAATGIVTTVAGTGTAGFSGDGGRAVAARLAVPRGIALDGDATLYVADSGNHRVRRVNLGTGTITTVAGTGSPGYAGDGGPAVDARLRGPRGLTVDAAGRLIIADTLNDVVRVVTP